VAPIPIAGAMAVPIAGVPTVAVAIAAMAVPVAGVPTVAAPIPVTAPAPIGMAVPIAAVAVVAVERPLRLMDGGTDRRPDLFPGRLGLGLGAARCRGNRLAHIPPGLARTSVTAVPAMPTVAASIRVTAVPAMPTVAASIRVTAALAVVAVAASIRVTAALAVVAVAASIRVTAALARIGSAFATATTVPAAAAATTLSVGNVGINRHERNVQTAKKRHQRDNQEYQQQASDECFHGWNLSLGSPMLYSSRVTPCEAQGDLHEEHRSERIETGVWCQWQTHSFPVTREA
jgi:hypothetical protein